MPVFSRLAVAVQLFAVILSPVLGAAAKPQYDYVIVGGGVTGLIVANRITEDKSSTCLGYNVFQNFTNNLSQRLSLLLRRVTMSIPMRPRSLTRPTT
jgi:hypothetical protein